MFNNSVQKSTEAECKYSKLAGKMDQEKKQAPVCSFPTIVIVFLCLQTVIIICVYPVIIGMVVISFKNDVANLELQIEHLKDRGTTLPNINSAGNGYRTTTSAERCICPQSNVQRDWLNDQDDSLNSAVDKTVRGTYLRCCATDEDSLKMLILGVFKEEHRRNRYSRERKIDRTGVTVAEVEKLVAAIIRRNKTDIQNVKDVTISASIPIAVHVTGRPSEGEFSMMRSISPHKRGMLKVGPWEYDRGKSFAKHVNVNDHYMIVPKSGIYHVYSQCYFRDEREEGQTNTNLNEYLHYTVLESNAYVVDPIDLMKSGRTHQGSGDSDYYYSSFHSGLFQLRVDDKIYMKVHLPNPSVKLDCNQDATFMGMYMISEFE